MLLVARFRVVVLLAGGLLAAAGGAGQAAELEDPRLDAERLGAAGIRRVEGRHLTLLTDLPASPELDELPRIFDAALPQWCEYFRVPPASAAAWKPVACVMQDKERFVGAGLYPDDLPPFPHGYSRGERLWLYEQPSGYYRRHLLLHEGTHAFMDRWLGGAGPPWYMEGIAELLATHRWEAGRLTLAVMPQRKEDVPYWGRVKVVKDETAAGRALTLDEIMRYDAQAHQRNEPYAWCWAAAAFFDQHPLTQAAFRELKASVQDRSPRFSRRLTDRLRDHWSQVVEDWQLFVSECDYGYDVARAAVNRRPAAELPAGATTVTIAADRGWQATGIRLEAGRTYLLTASGRYVVGGTESQPWPCEGGGVTIRYHRGQPLGKLLAAVSDLAGEAPAVTPLTRPLPIGLAGEITPERTGTLFLKINEAASGLADNRGTLDVRIERKH